MQTALDFLRQHNEVTFATCEANRPKLRIFQIMRQDDTTLYFWEGYNIIEPTESLENAVGRLMRRRSHD